MEFKDSFFNEIELPKESILSHSLSSPDEDSFDFLNALTKKKGEALDLNPN
jgi:hypothetical protein